MGEPLKEDKWNSTSALIFIELNSETRRNDDFSNTVFVKNGTAGNGVLGAIDYLNNHANGTKAYVINPVKFEMLEKKKRKRPERKGV